MWTTYLCVLFVSRRFSSCGLAPINENLTVTTYCTVIVWKTVCFQLCDNSLGRALLLFQLDNTPVNKSISRKKLISDLGVQELDWLFCGHFVESLPRRVETLTAVY